MSKYDFSELGRASYTKKKKEKEKTVRCDYLKEPN